MPWRVVMKMNSKIIFSMKAYAVVKAGSRIVVGMYDTNVDEGCQLLIE